MVPAQYPDKVKYVTNIPVNVKVQLLLKQKILLLIVSKYRTNWLELHMNLSDNKAKSNSESKRV